MTLPLRSRPARRFLLLAALLPTLALAPARAQFGGPSRVQVEAATRQEVRPTLRLTGVTEAIRRTTLSSLQDGLVVKRQVEFGHSYRKGETLLELDARKARAHRDAARAASAAAEATYRELANGTRPEEIAVARAELDRDRASRIEAEQNLRRQRDLMVRGATTQNELDQAVRSADVARAEEAAARANLSLLEAGPRREQIAAARARWQATEAELAVAERELEEMTALAPFDGVADEVLVEEGGWVKVGEEITQFFDLSRIDTMVLVPEGRVGEVPLGGRADCQFRQFEPPVVRTGKIVSIGARATASGKTFPVTIRFENPDRVIRAGMTARVDLPVGEAAKRLLIAKDAVVRAPGTPPRVFVVEGGKAAMRVVRLGVASGSRVEVLDGVQEGESVVIRGNERLRPGADVVVAGAGGEGPGAPSTGAPGGRNKASGGLAGGEPKGDSATQRAVGGRPGGES